MDRVRKSMNIDAINNMGYTGKNIGIAIIDTGMYKHLDFKENSVVFKDVLKNNIEMYDDNGHGTHVTGIIFGNGFKSKGRYKGISVDARVINIKALDSNGNGKVKNVLKAYNYIRINAKKYNIRIVNISIGANCNPMDDETAVLINETRKLWADGLIVVAAAGNNGPNKYSITAPGCTDKIITVGASDDVYRKYSGCGPTNNCILKPEIVCPGTNIISCDNNGGYKRRSGTSMAVPIVSGIIALVLEKNPNLSNKNIKKILYETCKDIGYSKTKQGWGEIDIIKIFEYI